MKRVMKVFLSYGMHDRTDEEQLKIREKLKKRIINYFARNKVTILIEDNRDAKTDGGRLSYLGLAIQKMDTCDAIIFDDDWYKHEGCIIERHVAELYGLKILGVDDEEK